MKLKREKSRAKGDVIVADGETTETSYELESDQPEITETTTAPPSVETALTGAESLMKPGSDMERRGLDELQTKTLDYETEKLLIFSK